MTVPLTLSLPWSTVRFRLDAPGAKRKYNSAKPNIAPTKSEYRFCRKAKISLTAQRSISLPEGHHRFLTESLNGRLVLSEK